MAGVYVHIPFCKSRCRYCDFFSSTQFSQQNAYVEALLSEWQDRQHELKEEVRTIYIGGGTPSVLGEEAMRLLGDGLLAMGNGSLGEMEVTMEANPGDITLARAQAWRAMGINRLSIGIQSFDDKLLSLIGRRHTAQQARQAVATAQAAGFDNLSIDLMYALPSQTMEQWQYDIAQALQLGVQHISSYGLIYEDGTMLTQMLEQGRITAVDEELEMAMYDYLVEALTAKGYMHYEVSNFALPERQSQHNSSYWNDTPYIGLGAGAHSYDGHQRQWNIEDIAVYIQQAIGHCLQPEREVLTAAQRHTERLMLGLRTQQGVEKQWVNQTTAQQYLQQGLLKEREGRLIATTQGFHILNRIIEDLL